MAMADDLDLLAQLAEQAKRKQAAEEAATRDAQERAARYHQTTEPAMQRLLDYLKQLTSHLNYLAEPLQGTYALPYYGEFIANMSPDFQTQFASGEDHSNIRLTVSATVPPESAPKVTLRAPIAGQFIDQTTELGLQLLKDVERSARGEIVEGSFQVHGSIKILITIEAAAAADEITFHFVNLDRFGTVTHQFQPEAVDDALLDRLGRYVTRQTNTLKREELPAEFREKLRRATQRNQSLLKSVFDQTS